MGTENPSHMNFPFRPVATPFNGPRTGSPFTSLGPVVGGEVPSFRPPPSQAPPFSSGPLAGPVPQSRSNDQAGTENPSHANFPFRPAAIPFNGPRTTSSGPVVGGEVPSFRPPPSQAPSFSSGPLAGPVPPSMSNNQAGLPPPSQAPSFSSGPLAGPVPSSRSNGQAGLPPPSQAPSFSSGPLAGPVPPSRSNGQAGLPPQSYGLPQGGTVQRFPSPGFSSPGQAPLVHPPGRPASHLPSPPPVTLSSQPQKPPTSLGSPPPHVDYKQPVTGVPQPSMEFPYPASRPNLHPSSQPVVSPYPASQGFTGYPASTGNQESFHSPQGGFGGSVPGAPMPFRPQPGGYAQSPPIGPPSSMYSSYQKHPPMPPTVPGQDLVEDFSSLSIGSAPGSYDSGVDSKSLPRPLDGDVEPKSFADMFPMNCNSRYLRLPTCALPNSQSLASRWHLPLGAVACPLAEAPEGEEVPVVNLGPSGIPRCRRCRIYVNPYVTFTDSGRKWKCNICSFLNDVTGDYFAPLDANGKRIDLDQRPELNSGSVDFIAPAEYTTRPPMPPVYCFLIDVSISAVRSRMLEVVAQTIKSSLDTLPGFPRTQIGFITFDSTIHFYNMKSTLVQPQMMVVSDLDDMFVPLPDDLLVNLSESRTVVDAFLDSLPTMFRDNFNVESAFGPALQGAFILMNRIGGKLLIFQNTIPSLGAGRLRLRGDDARIYGTDKEHTLRLPEDQFYKEMADDFSKYQIAVNVYAFSDKYADIASIGTLAKYTGGQVYYYPNFVASIHKDKLAHELARDLTRETAWEAVMRIRCGRGLGLTYHGNFILRSADLMALPAVDCDKAYAMQLRLEETLITTHILYFQVALLYSSSAGERRIRAHTAAVPVVADLGEMYRLADTGAIVSLLSRLAIENSLNSKLGDVRNDVQLRIAKAFKEYRSLYAVQHRLGGRVIYPESLKYLPLYGLALCKSTPIRGGFTDVMLDERCAAGYTVMGLPVKKLLKLLYPNLIRVDEILSKANSSVEESDDIWKKLPLTVESLDSRGVYIFDDGFRFVIWFGSMLPPDLAKNLLGDEFSDDYSKVFLTERDNETSRRLTRLIETYRKNDPSYFQLCHILRQGEQSREGFFLANLIEDQNSGINGYADWFVQLFRQVQNA